MTNERPQRPPREGLRKGVYIIPNLFTTGTLFAGFYAIIATMNGQFDIAAWFVLVAGIFDVIDGKVARMTGTTSRFGVEYDSLADLVAFGVAPGVLMYAWALQPFGKLGWLAAFLYVVCGALRLARFNVQANTVESRRFVGLPIPAAASMVAVCVLLFYEMGGTGTIKKLSVLLLIYVLAFLLVSNTPYHSLKDPDLFKRQPFMVLVLAIMGIIVIVAAPEIMLFFLSSAYVASGPIIWFLSRGRSGFRTPVKPPQASPPEDSV